MLPTHSMTIVCSVGILLSVADIAAAQETIADKVISELNDRIAATRVTEGNKSYRVLFDAEDEAQSDATSSGRLQALKEQLDRIDVDKLGDAERDELLQTMSKLLGR